jgi:hypothetical protein
MVYKKIKPYIKNISIRKQLLKVNNFKMIKMKSNNMKI